MGDGTGCVPAIFGAAGNTEAFHKQQQDTAQRDRSLLYNPIVSEFF